MVNMIKILVLRLRETNDKLRKIVEQYTPTPVDTGGVFTVDEDSASPSPAANGNGKNAQQEQPKTGKQYRSDDIVKELFDPASAGQNKGEAAEPR